MRFPGLLIPECACMSCRCANLTALPTISCHRVNSAFAAIGAPKQDCVSAACGIKTSQLRASCAQPLASSAKPQESWWPEGDLYATGGRVYMYLKQELRTDRQSTRQNGPERQRQARTD